MTESIVLAFSGGLDTSFCIPWLVERHGARVVALTVDTGGLDDAARQALRERALGLGASEFLLVDAREAFFHETLRFLLMGNVLRGHLYPLCVGAERGLQARIVAENARRLGAKAVAHGCTAAGNDQVRFEVALRTLAPEVEILAPIRDEGLSREDEARYLQGLGFPMDLDRAAYSINRGLWGVTIGGRETTGTVQSIPEHAWVLTRGAFDAPRPPARHVIAFERGVPKALDGIELAPPVLIERLQEIASRFGIGRGIHLGDTILGTKGRVAFEAPAAHVLIAAHRELEKLTLTGRQQRLKDVVATLYGDWIHEGQLLEPCCRDAEALFLSSQERVTGEASVLLRTGAAFVEGVTSPFSLAAASRAVYGEAASEWTAQDARGYSRMLALPGMLHARAAEAS
ncbi:MAG: argininosuccinate synthase [Acidobacteriota bacterium]